MTERNRVYLHHRSISVILKNRHNGDPLLLMTEGNNIDPHHHSVLVMISCNGDKLLVIAVGDNTYLRHCTSLTIMHKTLWHKTLKRHQLRFVEIWKPRGSILRYLRYHN